MLFTLAQVYGSLWDGEHCLSYIAGGVNCSNYYAWLTNFVQNREGNCATFCGARAGVALRGCSSHNRHAWLQSQRISWQILGQLLGAASCGRKVIVRG